LNDRIPVKDIQPTSFDWRVEGRVATITLSRPERKNPLTFEAYRELSDTFDRLRRVDEVRAVVLTGAGGNFCSGGDVHEIIGPLVGMREEKRMDKLLAFTRLTGELVRTMRACPQPIIAAIDGMCVGAGAILAMASDIRLGTPRSRVAFLFVKEAERWGFYNRLVEPDDLQNDARTLATAIATGPTFAHAMTKKSLHQEWAMGVDEAIEAEAQAQAICMQTEDFARAYRAFVAKEKPVFQGD
jgi:enoyl-CoA hydratase/carnithine racemase